MKLLVVEDDLKLGETVKHYLVAENYQVNLAVNSSEALELLKNNVYDQLILDWEIPGQSGLEICLQYRQSGGRAAILFLTGRTTLEDLSAAYESGADDYLRKPFHMQEFLLRVAALLRRSESVTKSVLKLGPFVMDSTQFRVSKNGKELKLSRMEFELLQLFMRNAGRLFSPEELLETVWKDSDDKTSNALRTCMKKLRLKIDDENQESMIQNVHGLGYRFRVD
ncbi:MAG: response regulator transcription factor [Candidatus Obscuribacterales bacterium]|nr:response regulator transcription factor [Candidatus Obscuribacterales bacterium]